MVPILCNVKVNDDAGNRYLLFPLLFILNDLKKSAAYFEWYKPKAEYDLLSILFLQTVGYGYLDNKQSPWQLLTGIYLLMAVNINNSLGLYTMNLGNFVLDIVHS